MYKEIFTKTVFISLMILFLSCERKSDQQIVIFHAGSLSYPMKNLIESFNQEYPDIMVISEAAGSLATARKITDLQREADIIALADYQIIDQMLIPDYCSFNVHFATNSIGIAYTKKSKYSIEINASNWLEILSRDDVRFGASDPDSDPCGYRTRMLMLLQEKIMSDTTLSAGLFGSDRYHQRPKETDLIALLETSTVDYIFLYESVSRQHGLEFLILPDSINLSKPGLNDWYSEASLAVRGSGEQSKIFMKAEAITYGLTLLNQAPNRENALIFINWLLNQDKGLAQMKSSGFEPINPPMITYNPPFPEILNEINIQTLN